MFEHGVLSLLRHSTERREAQRYDVLRVSGQRDTALSWGEGDQARIAPLGCGFKERGEVY